MKPSDKWPVIEMFLEAMAGRTTAITNHLCLPEPIGCGKPIGPFRDNLSLKEYRISGLCQECQDKIFDVID